MIIVIFLMFPFSSCSKESDDVIDWWIDKNVISGGDWTWLSGDEELSQGDIIENEYTQRFNDLLNEKGFEYSVEFHVLNSYDFLDLSNIYSNNSNQAALDNARDTWHDIDIFTIFGNNFQDALALDSYLENSDLFKEFYGSLPSSFWDIAKVNNEIKFIPYIRTAYAYIEGAIIDLELAEKYSVTSDNFKDYDSIENLLKEVYEGENAKVLPISYYDFQSTRLFNDRYIPLVLDYLCDLRLVKNGDEWEINDLGEIEEYREYVKWVEGLNAQNLTGINLTSGEFDQLQEENLFMYLGTYYDERIDAGRRKDKHQFPLSDFYINGMGGNAIYSGSDKPKEALELLALINTDQELSELFILGIENKDYEIRDGLAYSLNENKGSATRLNSVAPCGNYLIITPTDLMGKDAKEDILSYMESIEVPEVYGFTPEITDEIEELLINLYGLTKGKSVTIALTLEEGALEYLDERNSWLKENGLDRLKDLLNEQLETYYKK